MSERSYIRQQPRWLQVLKVRQERAEWEAKERAAQTWRERNEFNRFNIYANQPNGLGVLGQGGNT